MPQKIAGKIFPKSEKLYILKKSFILEKRKSSHQSGSPDGARATAATRMVSAGIDLVVVANILGHSDIRITASRYAHPLPENKIKAIQSLDNFSSQSGLRIAQ